MKSLTEPACAARCPLCGAANECQLATAHPYKGPCWCERVAVTREDLVRLPADLPRSACLCRDCLAKLTGDAGR
jgi:hypothetical protein